MTRYTLILTATALAAISSVAVAGEIYKWVDEDGNTHYVDRPSGEPSEERLVIVSGRTDNAAVRANVQARLDRQTTRQEAREQAATDAKNTAEELADQEQREQQCQTNRERLERYLQSRRLYREDDNGERVYLDDEEMMEARERVQEKIQETCS